MVYEDETGSRFLEEADLASGWYRHLITKAGLVYPGLYLDADGKLYNYPGEYRPLSRPAWGVQPVRQSENWEDDRGHFQRGFYSGPGLTVVFQVGDPDKAVDGCQVEDLLGAAYQRLDYLNMVGGGKLACPENLAALEKLREAIELLFQGRERRRRAEAAGGTAESAGES